MSDEQPATEALKSSTQVAMRLESSEALDAAKAIERLRALLGECVGYVALANNVADEMARKAERHIQRTDVPVGFIEPNRAEADRHAALLARIDAELGWNNGK